MEVRELDERSGLVRAMSVWDALSVLGICGPLSVWGTLSVWAVCVALSVCEGL